jgi:hypothetical protein
VHGIFLLPHLEVLLQRLNQLLKTSLTFGGYLLFRT